MNEEVPNNLLREVFLELLSFLDVPGNVSTSGVLHDDAEKVAINKRLVVADLRDRGISVLVFWAKREYDVRILDRSEQANLIDGVHTLQLRHLADICLFHCIDQSIRNPLHLVD